MRTVKRPGTNTPQYLGLCRISGAPDFGIFRYPVLIRIRQTTGYPAGYPESGKQTAGYPAGYPDPVRMDKLLYLVFNLEEVNLKLKFSTIHQNCQYPAGYPDSGKQSAGYPAGYPDPADHRISGIRWRDQILIRS